MLGLPHWLSYRKTITLPLARSTFAGIFLRLPLLLLQSHRPQIIMDVGSPSNLYNTQPIDCHAICGPGGITALYPNGGKRKPSHYYPTGIYRFALKGIIVHLTRDRIGATPSTRYRLPTIELVYYSFPLGRWSIGVEFLVRNSKISSRRWFKHFQK